MNSLVCVDANIIVRILVPGPFSEKATTLWEQLEKEGMKVTAPAFFAYEVTSTLRRLVHLKEIEISQGDRAFKEFVQLPIRLSHQQDILPLAWSLAKRFNRPRAYDTAYLALAQLRNCDLWTADEKLYNVVKGQLEWVRWVGDYNPGKNGEGAKK